MRNVGMMTKAQLKSIISQLPANKITVSESDIYIGVKVVKSGQDILIAAKIRSLMWHVRAREGLITTHK